MRNANWKHDERLKETLEEYSRQGLASEDRDS